jgi:DNA polymerase elongation subunit (family B)
VKDNHTIYAGRNDRFCHTGQSVYGLFGNPVFQTLYSRKTASDCTSIVRTWLKKLARILEINGFIPLYGFTDSIFVLVPPNFKKEQLMFLIDIFIKEAVTHVPFAMDTFNLGIEEEIKMIWFVAKNCYLFVTSTDEIKYKSTLLNTNTPKAVMKLFEEYMRPIIIEKLDIPFTKKELIEQMKIILEKEPELAAQEYKVGKLSDYKVKTSLHYQISNKYGEGRHFMIPNKQGLGVGLGKSTKKKRGIRHCTIEEFKNKNLVVNDIDLTYLLSHLKSFYERNEQSDNEKNKYKQQIL